MPKLENGANGSFRVDSKPYQKGVYEPVFNNDLFGLRRLGTKGEDSDYLVKPILYSDWTDNNDVPFASISAIYTYLESFFFRETATSLTLDTQVVNTYNDLPDPTLHNTEWWAVLITTQTGVWPFRTIYSKGFWRSDGVVWEFKGADVPVRFKDDTTLFVDDISGFGLGWILDDLTGNRQVTWQDKDGVPQYFDDLSVYEGQVKIIDGNGVKPTIIWTVLNENTFQQIIYTSPLNIFASPTTQWPENIISPTEDDIYDFVNDTFIENTVLGQINIWRLLFNFSGKSAGAATGVITRIQNPLSGFSEDYLVNIPDERTSGQFSVIFITIADAASLPSPFGSGQGYEIIMSADDPITIILDSITRINNVKHIR